MAEKKEKNIDSYYES